MDPFERIRRDLAALRSTGHWERVFGASTHRFALNPLLTDAELSKFEAEHRVSLPADYQQFLTRVGNGGAGPDYGLFKLGEMDGDRGDKPWPSYFVGNLSAPFPHEGAWNDISKYPITEENTENFDAQMDSFEEEYWSPRHVNGAIPICHHGCALRSWLVVSGTEAGNVWLDRRADLRGLSPGTLPNGKRATFLSWYLKWLDEAMKSAL
jgi:hypothetical protein